MKMIQITPSFWVAVHEDRVVFWHPKSMTECSVAEALTVAGVLQNFVEAEATSEILRLSRAVREDAERRRNGVRALP